LARLRGRENLIKGNQRKCSRYCDCELHVGLPVLAGATSAKRIGKDFAEVKRQHRGGARGLSCRRPTVATLTWRS
jgi:hypothetical protein